MARKYVRDNRGRFASGGSGATARGGRLKTASGNKRATQTMKAAGAGGVIKGRTARTVAGEKVMAKMAKRAPVAKRISAARPGGTVAKPKGLKPGVVTAPPAAKATATARIKGGRGAGRVAKPKSLSRLMSYEVKINSRRGSTKEVVQAESKGAARVSAMRQRYGSDLVRHIGKVKIKAKKAQPMTASQRRNDAWFRKLKNS